jgi:N-acetylmuramoyl-L-alanine amidase
MALLSKKKYNIPTQNIIGHSDIAPTRKKWPKRTIPGHIGENGFGLWKDDILETALDFNPEQDSNHGYDTKIFPCHQSI